MRDDIFWRHYHVLEGFIVAAIVLIGTLAVVHAFNKSVCVYDVSTMFPEKTWSKACESPDKFPLCCHRTGLRLSRGMTRSCSDYADT